jgi:hypothetical protein
MAAQNHAEAPAETAAVESDAPDEPAQAFVPAVDPDTGMGDEEPFATLQPENEAD